MVSILNNVYINNHCSVDPRRIIWNSRWVSGGWLKDMIITGGVNVYPVEIEGILVQMEGVKDAAVIGIPDKQWGETIKAVIVKKPDSSVTEESIIACCREKLAKYKVPKSVDFVDSIPRTLTGKILKKDLRKAYWGKGDIQVS
jgi:acyl-CoA synthetase (AMP-forming)/AMP-acid ligase II